MKINFIGSFTTGYVGEVADETHLANELEFLGHTVKRIPRDIWKAFVEGARDWPDITDNLKADINIISKSHYFVNGDYIKVLKHWSGAPVFYWVWDYMQNEDWHMEMVKAADLYIANDVFSKNYEGMENKYYFPFDVLDAGIDRVISEEKKYKVAFFGTWLGQGDRVEWLTEINKEYPIKIFSWNHEEWQKRGFDAEPAVWGKEFAQKVAESKIVLGFNVEDHCWGYWSNRIGKVLGVGGFLLQRYVPGMELFLREGAEYFSSIDEAKSKINHYLNHRGERETVAQRGYEIARDRLTSRARVKELIILAERYLKGGLNGRPQ